MSKEYIVALILMDIWYGNGDSQIYLPPMSKYWYFFVKRRLGFVHFQKCCKTSDEVSKVSGPATSRDRPHPDHDFWLLAKAEDKLNALLDIADSDDGHQRVHPRLRRMVGDGSKD